MSKVPRRNLSKRNPYYLPPYKAKEIFYFCLQYNDWKARLKEYKMNSSDGEWSNPTEKEAMTHYVCMRNMEIVEDACKVAFREQWELLLLGVIDDKITYDYLKLKKGLAVGKNWYYDLKREVYYHVAQKDRV